MANPFYEPGERRAQRVNDLFGGIARRYDLINDLQSFGLHRLWKRRLVTLAGVRSGQQALDVCCGTGDVALRLARGGARVVGLDFSEPMLRVARERTRAATVGPNDLDLEFVQGDALDLPFEANTFHAVTISYGLRNLADLERGLRELWRVARPDGRLVALDFGKPANPLWRRIYFAYLRGVVPWLGRLLVGNPEAYAYILESLGQYPGQHHVADLMRELPMTDIRVLNLLGGMMSIHSAIKPERGDAG